VLLVEHECGVTLMGADRQEPGDEGHDQRREEQENPSSHAARVIPVTAVRARRSPKVRAREWRARAVDRIISRVRDEDFERLYAAHAEPLIGFLVYRTGDRATAEDVMADTFERVLRTRFRFDPRKSSEKTWIYTIAMNVLRDQARRRAAETRAVERTPAPVGGGSDRALDFVEDRDELRRALDCLSDDEREAVALRFGADLTVPEIARVTGEKLTTVEGRVYRALRKLRDQLD
jgi:RNA polymerase sigma factor (sigma-70 family)